MSRTFFTKTLIVIIATFSISVSSFAGEISVGIDKTRTIFVADGMSLPFIFEDNDLSKENISRIIDDLEIIYFTDKDYTIRDLQFEKHYLINTEVFVSKTFVALLNKREYRRHKLHRKHLRGIVNIDKKPYLIIPKALSNAYTNVFKLIDSNSGIINKLHRFMVFMNNLELDEIPDFKDLFYVFDKTKYSKEFLDNLKFNKKEFIRQYKGYRHVAPSILSISRGEETYPGLGNRLVSKVYILYDGRLSEGMPFVYDEKRWKILFIELSI